MTDCCPKCKSEEGYQFPMTVTYAMVSAPWGTPEESSDGGDATVCGLAECLSCGARFRLATIEAGRVTHAPHP